MYILIQHPLGIVPRDENKTKDMVGIMQEIQQYVPRCTCTDFEQICEGQKSLRSRSPIFR